VELDARVARYLERAARSGLGVRDVASLSGDASDRSYYRIVTDGGARVLALLPQPFDPGTLPFLNVARLFEAIPVRVPRVDDVSGEDGILLLEDAGDELLQVVPSSERPPLYREAVEIVARIQRRGAELASPSFIPYGVVFDEEKLTWELEYFRKHFLEGLAGARLSPQERDRLKPWWARLASDLSRRPRVLCHRDYHSRNLMRHDGGLVVLDFQDARLGPRTYDLVSLLSDSYVALDAELVRDMKRYYAELAGIAAADLEEEYAPMALQRNLKALGTFGYQIGVRGKEVYRPHVPHTLALVRANLDRHPEWDALRLLLAAHLPELS